MNWAVKKSQRLCVVLAGFTVLLLGCSGGGPLVRLGDVTAQELQLANYYSVKHLPIVVTTDATDGLNRSAEAPDLVELGSFRNSSGQTDQRTIRNLRNLLT